MNVIKLIETGKWTEIYDLIIENKIDINKPIMNGNNIFHIACIRGIISFIKKVINIKKLQSFKTNNEGLTGTHLYYRYGGTDPFLIKNDNTCLIDDHEHTLISSLIDRIELLDLLVDKMIDTGCIDNIMIRSNEYIYDRLMKQYVNNKKYIHIIEKIYVNLNSKYDNIIFIAIKNNCIDVVKMLIKHNFDFMNLYSSLSYTPLAESVYFKRYEITMIILAYIEQKYGINGLNEIIHKSEINFNYRPIFVAINNNDFISINFLIKLLIDKINDKKYFEYTNNSHNTYLHEILMTGMLNEHVDLLSFFIEHTDLNQENYDGLTPAQLLFESGLWKQYKDIIKNRVIDLVKTDDLGNNCYSYIAKRDMNEFLELSKTIKQPQINKKSNIETIKLFVDGDNNFGLFNADMIHYMLYMYYLMNKHDNMYVPNQIYDNEQRNTDMYYHSMVSSYVTHDEHEQVTIMTRLFLKYFYSYMPHRIIWYDNDCHFINPLLVENLKHHNKTISVDKHRYIVIDITVIVATDALHANMLIYDRKTKIAWRFEPFGISAMKYRETDKENSLDAMIYNILKQVYGDIQYNDPDKFLHGLNFQLVDKEGDNLNHNLGDPLGYCLAWSLWFVDLVVTQKQDDIKQLMNSFFERRDINILLTDGEDGEITKSKNYYLDFIRKYAHKLDREKNNILLNLGVKKYNLYNRVFSDEIKNKIIDLFKIVK